MSPEQANQYLAVVEQLTQCLMTAVMCTEKLRADLHPSPAHPKSDRRGKPCPLMDRSRWQLVWRGRCCFLGYTVSYRLAERFCKRPNHYISGNQLIEEVWDGSDRSLDTVRSGVRHLRHRLCAAGMPDLAQCIRGCGGAYGLILDRPY
jgi:hypothetical protein